MTSKYRFDREGSLVDPDDYFLLRQNYPGIELGPPVNSFVPGQLWVDGAQVGVATNWAKVFISGPAAVHNTVAFYAITTAGALYSWGTNGNGMLGLGDTSDRASPTFVSNGPWLKVVGGRSSAWALHSSGDVYACGLVNGNTTFTYVSGQPGGAVDLACTAYPHGVYVVRSNGTLWGYNTGFDVGSSNVYVPPGAAGNTWAQLGSDTNWLAVSANQATFQAAVVALKADGSRWIWGEVDPGDYGSFASIANQGLANPYPQNINQLCIDSSMMTTDAGSNGHTTAVTSAGGIVYDANVNTSINWARVFGDMGIDTSGALRSAAFPYTMLHEEIGWAWAAQGGSREAYISGNVTPMPAPINPLTSQSRLLWHVKSHFDPYTYDDKQLAYPWDNVRQWKQVASNAKSYLAVTTDGHLYAWGDYSRHLLGLATDATHPMRVGSDTNWHKVAVGLGLGGGPQATAHFAAIKLDNSLWVWGSNYEGQLGLGSVGGEVTTPTQVAGTWYDIKLGYGFSIAVGSDSGTPRIFTWGSDHSGAHGTGSDVVVNIHTPAPRVIAGLVLSAGSTVALGYAGADERHFVLTKDTNTNVLWAWGSNAQGQLGFGTFGDVRNTPAQVPGVSVMTFVAGVNRSAVMLSSAPNGIYVAGDMTGQMMCVSRLHGTPVRLTTFSETGDDSTTPRLAEFDLYTIIENRIIMFKTGGGGAAYKFEGTGREAIVGTNRPFQSIFQMTPGSDAASGVNLDQDGRVYFIETITPVA